MIEKIGPPGKIIYSEGSRATPDEIARNLGEQARHGIAGEQALMHIINRPDRGPDALDKAKKFSDNYSSLGKGANLGSVLK